MLQSSFTLPKQMHLLLPFLGTWLTGCQSGKPEQIESGAYRQRLLMYKGTIIPDSLLQAEDNRNIRDQQIKLAIQGYGVANWYWYNANKTKAREFFKKVIQTNNWSAFGCIATEVDLKNMQ